MSRKMLLAKVRKLEAITVERGASPAEAATAASLARRLIRQSARHHDADVTVHAPRHFALAPGVHVRTCTAPLRR
jgi:hypothetical protein